MCGIPEGMDKHDSIPLQLSSGEFILGGNALADLRHSRGEYLTVRRNGRVTQLTLFELY